MKLKDKFIQTLYEIVIYVFPFLILLFILVSFQLWKLENTKENMTNRLHNSTEMIEAARTELYAMHNGLVSAKDSFAYHSMAALPHLGKKAPHRPAECSDCLSAQKHNRHLCPESPSRWPSDTPWHRW